MLLRGYKGDPELLGRAEQYMLVMMTPEEGSSASSSSSSSSSSFSKSMAKRMQCMVYKQQFTPRVSKLRAMIHDVEKACDDVKLSGRCLS